MNLLPESGSGKLTYLGQDPFEVTMSILSSELTAQSRGCKTADNIFYRINNGQITVFE